MKLVTVSFYRNRVKEVLIQLSLQFVVLTLIDLNGVDTIIGTPVKITQLQDCCI